MGLRLRKRHLSLVSRKVVNRVLVNQGHYQLKVVVTIYYNRYISLSLDKINLGNLGSTAVNKVNIVGFQLDLLTNENFINNN